MRMHIRSVYFATRDFPSLEELKKHGWHVPGGDDGMIKASLAKNIDGIQVLVTKGHESDMMGCIYPLDISGPGMSEEETLAAIAELFESLGG